MTLWDFIRAELEHQGLALVAGEEPPMLLPAPEGALPALFASRSDSRRPHNNENYRHQA